jgi:hypothetical protein
MRLTLLLPCTVWLCLTPAFAHAQATGFLGITGVLPLAEVLDGGIPGSPTAVEDIIRQARDSVLAGCKRGLRDGGIPSVDLGGSDPGHGLLRWAYWLIPAASQDTVVIFSRVSIERSILFVGHQGVQFVPIQLDWAARSAEHVARRALPDWFAEDANLLCRAIPTFAHR